MSAVTVRVRRARAADGVARGELVRSSQRAAFLRSCLYFLCQELTLEGCVLGGAVLFIFADASPAACCTVLPAAAMLVALAVLAADVGIAENQLQAIRGELEGWVAEAPALSSPPARCGLQLEDEDRPPDLTAYRQVVGMVSVSRHSGAARRGWLHALHVHPRWRRRGVARALLAAARAAAARAGLGALDALASDLQHDARLTLHRAGWRVSGSYSRRVLGAVLTLPMALLSLKLPSAPPPPPVYSEDSPLEDRCHSRTRAPSDAYSY